MTRHRLPTLALAVLLGATTLTGCRSPFSDHAKDVQQAWGRMARNMHRQWDRHFLGLDWDDPYHEWHDPSYSTIGPPHP